ncbi:MAG: helix-turn-helix transcriptional regulator [Firmicutes bacterium]|nr:helix-turn-helix transcriptional regulator [Bacillota bacterium]
MKLDIYKIKCFMASQQISQKDLADRMGIMANTISATFKRESATTTFVGKLAHALGTTAEEITVKE